MPNLTATDGTGLTVNLVLSDGTPWSAVSLYAYRIDLDEPAGTWQFAGSVTLDGGGEALQVLSVPSRGLWHFAALSGGVPWGNAARVIVTRDGPSAVLTQVRNAVRLRIESLGLPILQVAENITAEDLANLSFPCVVLLSEGVSETDDGGLNLTDDVSYPVRVEICDRGDMQDNDMLAKYEFWRETIASSFRSHRLDSPFENLICTVDYDAIIDPSTPRFQFMVSTLTVRAKCRVFRL